MSKEKLRNAKHKIPKFCETDDGSFDWQEKIEIQYLRRNLSRKSRKPRDQFEKW